jgi:hypothetical protein
MTTSRFARSAVRTRTITGTTSVGGSTSTVVSIYPDSTIRFTDRNSKVQVIHVPHAYTTDFQNRIQPSSGQVGKDDPYAALMSLVDVLIARA